MEILVAIGGLLGFWLWAESSARAISAERTAQYKLQVRRKNAEQENEKRMHEWWELNRARRTWAHLTLSQRRMAIESRHLPYREIERELTRHSVLREMATMGVQYCYLCSKQLPLMWDQVHLDHIVPLARGGTHTRDNVALVHPSCNIKKGASLTRLKKGRRGPLPNRSKRRLKLEQERMDFLRLHADHLYEASVREQYNELFPPDPCEVALTPLPELMKVPEL